jgi:hypothetical protein
MHFLWLNQKMRLINYLIIFKLLKKVSKKTIIFIIILNNIINLLFLLDWVKFYRQKWVIASLNNCISKIDDNIWKMSPDNTNIAEAAHALSNSHGKNLKLVTAILQYVNILVTDFFLR